MPFLTGYKKKAKQWVEREPAPPQPITRHRPDLPAMMGGGLFLPKIKAKKGKKKKEFMLTDTQGDWDITGGGF